MKLKVIFSLLFVSNVILAQSKTDTIHIPTSLGCNDYCVYKHEEGVIYTWYWMNKSYIMVSHGGLSDLVIPKSYYVYNTLSKGNNITINAKDTTNFYFTRKEVFIKEHICILYCNFLDTVSIDSLSTILKKNVLKWDIQRY